MSALGPEEVRTLVSAAGLKAEDWDPAELAGLLEAQWAEIDLVRDRLAQTDEPALRFDPRWE